MPRLPFLLLGLLLFPLPMIAQEWDHRETAFGDLGADIRSLPVLSASPFDAAAAAADDALRDRDGKLPLHARFVAVMVEPTVHGVWTDAPDGGRIWRAVLASHGALAVEVFLSGVVLPPASRLYVYDPDGGQLQGGFTGAHVAPDGSLSTLPVLGDRVVMEYHEPYAVRGEGRFIVDRLAHGYRMLEDLRSGACEVDVNCGEGEAWSEQRDAVVRIRIVIPAGTGFCTGTLMNNTAQDCSPYILTAFHCGEESTTANFSQYIFLFNYQRACGSGSASASQVMTGCVRRADSNDSGAEGGGTFGSDFMLVELNTTVPAAYNAFYAGWDATVLGSSSGVTIHHPDADVKKISTYASTLTSASWAGFTNGSHWRVTWVPTTNGHGVTEPGSSGAPLFNTSKRVIGTLTGGQSCCTSNGCGPQTGLNQPDYYGKLSYHWDSNPNPPEEKLRLFLSPTGNFITLAGSYSPCGTIGIVEPSAGSDLVVSYDAASGRYTVRPMGERFGQGTATLMDATGRVVRSEALSGRSELVVDPSGLGSGVYVLQVIDRGIRGAQRIYVAQP
jgi:hypothetical protein